jgi:hypothetical protein
MAPVTKRVACVPTGGEVLHVGEPDRGTPEAAVGEEEGGFGVRCGL